MGVSVSPKTLNYIFLFLLYVPIVLTSYWKLIPRLSPTTKRIASAFLAAQVLVIALWIAEYDNATSFNRGLWHLEREQNIPSILASTQLMLVGCIALITSWLDRTGLIRQRLYLVGIGVVFPYLGLDDFFDWGTSWWKTLGLEASRQEAWIIVGAIVAATTIGGVMRSSRRIRIWHLCLLMGLLLLALGGLVIDDSPDICENLGFLRLSRCLQLYVLEESLEFLGAWLTLVAMLGHFSDTAATPKLRVRCVLYILPVLWILFLARSTATQPIARFVVAGTNVQPASAEFGPGVYLHGYQISKRITEIRLHLYLSPKAMAFQRVGYSIHVIDQISGESVANHNKWLNVWQGDWIFTPGYPLIFRHWMKLEIPPQTPTNRALWVVLTLWREKGGEYVRQKVLASDHQLLDDTQVVLGELVLPAASNASPPTIPLAAFDNGFTLDAVDIPARAQPGETLTIPLTWRSSSDGNNDLVQFLHFGHEESGAWWVYDQHPLGPRLPTRLWYNGLVDSETWHVPLPADLAPGRYTIFTGLYRQSDLERVPASDANGRPWLDARVPLGSLMIKQ